MYLPSISIALYDRALQAAQSGQTCNVIMLCTASMEAFFNEFMELGDSLIKNDKIQREEIEKNRQNNSLRGKFVSHFSAFYPKEIELINKLKNHEDSRNDIFAKIDTIKEYCDVEPWDKGNEIYSGYFTLVSIRNALMHPRSKMVEYGDNNFPKFLKPFKQQKKINYFNEINKRESWVEAIDTINFSKWCITVYEKMMISILKIMAKAKIEHIHNFPLMTSQHALYYLQSFRFPDDLLRKIIHPL